MHGLFLFIQLPFLTVFFIIIVGQTDLVLEAKHLDAFNTNFNGKSWSDCVFPRVVHCVEDVLVRQLLVTLSACVSVWVCVRACACTCACVCVFFLSFFLL